MESGCLFREPRYRRIRRQRKDPESFGKMLHHRQRALSDGASRPDNRELLHTLKNQ
jgi:hypothetical protein